MSDDLRRLAGRPTPLTFAENLTSTFGGAEVWLKREDLLHTGAHKLNNTLGQVRMAVRMGKRRVIAETLGIPHFAESAQRAGVDGLIVPDLPYDEAAELSDAVAPAGLDLVLLAAPTTAPERLSVIAARSRGFLYFVTVTGVTGARSDLPAELPSQLERARKASAVPVAAGFGIATPEQARGLAEHADAVVVGSAIVRALASPEGGEAEAVALVSRLAAALRH